MSCNYFATFGEDVDYVWVCHMPYVFSLVFEAMICGLAQAVLWMHNGKWHPLCCWALQLWHPLLRMAPLFHSTV